MPTPCDGLYGVPAVPAVGNGETGVCGESNEGRIPEDGPKPRPYDGDRDIVPDVFGLPAKASEYR